MVVLILGVVIVFAFVIFAFLCGHPGISLFAILSAPILIPVTAPVETGSSKIDVKSYSIFDEKYLVTDEEGKEYTINESAVKISPTSNKPQIEIIHREATWHSIDGADIVTLLIPASGMSDSRGE